MGILIRKPDFWIAGASRLRSRSPLYSSSKNTWGLHKMGCSSVLMDKRARKRMLYILDN
ncbi:unnamed protein product [Trichogramma brassicae]|uniref:Uncharacterized protein n=1 Tax=Trichogramma brassicae TaxID=86971 RepID=A0A6H5INX9_9HYME|nr:unnamed protein product [Trichogramma brassicae]